MVAGESAVGQRASGILAEWHYCCRGASQAKGADGRTDYRCRTSASQAQALSQYIWMK
jgi:hypothetical protein